jgi:hypothetical protein
MKSFCKLLVCSLAAFILVGQQRKVLHKTVGSGGDKMKPLYYTDFPAYCDSESSYYSPSQCDSYNSPCNPNYGGYDPGQYSSPCWDSPWGYTDIQSLPCTGSQGWGNFAGTTVDSFRICGGSNQTCYIVYCTPVSGSSFSSDGMVCSSSGVSSGCITPSGTGPNPGGGSASMPSPSWCDVYHQLDDRSPCNCQFFPYAPGCPWPLTQIVDQGTYVTWLRNSPPSIPTNTAFVLQTTKRKMEGRKRLVVEYTSTFSMSKDGTWAREIKRPGEVVEKTIGRGKKGIYYAPQLSLRTGIVDVGDVWPIGQDGQCKPLGWSEIPMDGVDWGVKVVGFKINTTNGKKVSVMSPELSCMPLEERVFDPRGGLLTLVTMDGLTLEEPNRSLMEIGGREVSVELYKASFDAWAMSKGKE